MKGAPNDIVGEIEQYMCFSPNLIESQFVKIVASLVNEVQKKPASTVPPTNMVPPPPPPMVLVPNSLAPKTPMHNNYGKH